VRAFLNFDGTGAAGPGLLFETGPGWGAPLDAWAGAAPAPAGASFATEIYRRLPNDTDFTVVKDIGAYGLNFAPVLDSYAYHTDRDLPSRVSDATLRHEIVTAVATVRALDGRVAPTAPRAETPTYFAIAGRAVLYGPHATLGISLVALLAGIAAWLRLSVVGWRRAGALGLVVTGALAAIAGGLALATMLGWVTALRAVRGELHPWYAAPHWFLAWLAVSALTVAWIVARASWRLPARLQPWRGPAAVWWITLPVWIALAGVLSYAAPAASYLAAWPLIAAGVAVGATAAHDRLLRVASVLAAIAAGLFWIVDAIRLLRFVVALLGWMPIVTPAPAYPALLAICAVMLALPLAAAAARTTPPSTPFLRRARAPVAAVVALGLLAWAAPSYTWDRPHRRVVRYVQDDVLRRAWWEVGGNEPAVEIGAGAPVSDWAPITGGLPTAAAVGRIAKPFTYRAEVEPDPGPPAAIVAGQLTRQPYTGGWRLDITVSPRLLTTARIVLPPTARPVTASIAGVSIDGRWTATYAGVPASGLTVTLTFDAIDSSAFGGAVVVLTTPVVPGSGGLGSPPRWLSVESSAWTVRAVHIVPLAVVVQ
jgi:hypothetical protein